MEKDVMTTITIRISQKEKERLQKIAKGKDLTLSQVIRKAIKMIFEENPIKG